MDDEQVIANMRARVAQCRRLAKYINDPRTTDALLSMAEAIEADIRSLEFDPDNNIKMEITTQS